ncbi:MAG: TonB-dependent receptor domain-containing protein [Terriglobales bacterium]
MAKQRRALAAAVAAVLALGAGTLWAQSTSATLSGTVLDPDHAVVPAARVTVIRAATSLRREQMTDRRGLFSLTGLPPGRYEVLVSHAGFRRAEIKNVVLNANAVVSLPVMLSVGSARQEVTVNDRPALVNLSMSVSNTIDRRLVGSLPLNGQSFQALITLSPGVQLAPIYGTGGNPGQFSVNGMRSNANYFTVDGVSANFGSAAYGGYGGLNDASTGATAALSINGSFSDLVSADDLQEITVQTSTFSPKYGRSPGAQVAMVTRSGSNQFHGDLFEYLRNNVLDATDYFSQYLNTGKQALRYNDFGGTFGGPVMLPGYNGRKHRTYFFFSYEGDRFVLPQAAQVTIVPSLAARKSAPTPASQAVVNAFPLPNGADLYTDANGNPCTAGSPGCAANGGAFFTSGWSNPSRSNEWSLRMDQSFGENYTLFARYSHALSDLSARTGSGGGNLSYTNNNDTATQTLTVGSTQIFSPRMVNQLTGNFSYQSTLASSTQDNFGGATLLPDSILFPANPCVGCSGVISIDGFTNAFLPTELGPANPSYSKNRQFNVVDNLSDQLSGHRLEFGADFRYLSPVSAPISLTTGLYFANLQALYANQTEFGLVGYDQPFSIGLKNFSAYAQDTWQVSRRLTLTYGVRWEVNPPPAGRNGAHPLTVQSLNLNTLDFDYLTLAPQGTPLFATAYTNFAPRFGFSYQLDPRPGRELVLHGGIGLFYDSGQNEFGNISFPYSQEYFLSPGQGVLGYPPLTLPVPGAYAQAPPLDFAPSPSNPASATVAVPGYQTPRVYEWNLTAERSFGLRTVASVAYVGSLGRDLEGMAQYLFGQSPPGTPGVPYSQNFSGLTVVGNWGVSNYNSLQAQLHSRFGNGFELISSYTWSHALDNGSNDAIQFIPSGIANPDINYGTSDYDVRQSLSEALTYNIPAVHWRSPLAVLLRNWALADIFSAHSALPFDVESENPSYLTNGGYYTMRADVVAGQPQWIYADTLPGTQTVVPGGKYLNPAAFADPPATAVQGDLGRNSLRGWPFYELDMGLHRQFPLGEHAHLIFRAEMFNVFNTVNFANPGLSGTNVVGYPAPGSPGFPLGFGEASETIAAGLGGGGNTGGFNPLFQAGGPRQLQFALRIEF